MKQQNLMWTFTLSRRLRKLSTVFSIISGIAAIWSAIYAISFAVSEFKNKKYGGGLTTLFTVATMFLTFIKGTGV